MQGTTALHPIAGSGALCLSCSPATPLALVRRGGATDGGCAVGTGYACHRRDVVVTGYTTLAPIEDAFEKHSVERLVAKSDVLSRGCATTWVCKAPSRPQRSLRRMGSAAFSCSKTRWQQGSPAAYRCFDSRLAVVSSSGAMRRSPCTATSARNAASKHRPDLEQYVSDRVTSLSNASRRQPLGKQAAAGYKISDQRESSSSAMRRDDLV